MRRIPVVGVSPSEFPGIVRDVGLGRTWEELLESFGMSGWGEPGKNCWARLASRAFLCI